jgi:hypothetical protein
VVVLDKLAAAAVAEEGAMESDEDPADELEVVHDEQQLVEDEARADEESELEEVVAIAGGDLLDDEDATDEEDAADESFVAEVQSDVESQAPVEPALDAPKRVAAEIGFDDQSAQAGVDEASFDAAPAASSPVGGPQADAEDASAPKRSSRRKSKAPIEAEAPSLFDGGLFASEDAIAEAATSASVEPQVELQPQAAAPGASIKPLPLDPRRRDLLDEVGCLFVERGRVAVSMLQKQYGMDFDEACVVLDDLQELGLIGPYLGGQRRDILLTRDQWKERLAKA